MRIAKFWRSLLGISVASCVVMATLLSLLTINDQAVRAEALEEALESEE